MTIIDLMRGHKDVNMMKRERRKTVGGERLNIVSTKPGQFVFERFLSEKRKKIRHSGKRMV
jgi:hypothetical protein